MLARPFPVLSYFFIVLTIVLSHPSQTTQAISNQLSAKAVSRIHAPAARPFRHACRRGSRVLDLPRARSSGPMASPATTAMISRGGGRRLPSSGSWPKSATSRWRFRRLGQQCGQKPSGPAFADPVAMASSPVCGWRHWSTSPLPPSSSCYPTRTCCWWCRRRVSWRSSRWPPTAARAVPGNRGQDLEPPSAGRRPSAGSQRPGDGRVPAVPHGRLTGVRPYCRACGRRWAIFLESTVNCDPHPGGRVLFAKDVGTTSHHVAARRPSWPGQDALELTRHPGVQTMVLHGTLSRRGPLGTSDGPDRVWKLWTGIVTGRSHIAGNFNPPWHPSTIYSAVLLQPTRSRVGGSAADAWHVRPRRN